MISNIQHLLVRTLFRSLDKGFSKARLERRFAYTISILLKVSPVSVLNENYREGALERAYVEKVQAFIDEASGHISFKQQHNLLAKYFCEAFEAMSLMVETKRIEDENKLFSFASDYFGSDVLENISDREQIHGLVTREEVFYMGLTTLYQMILAEYGVSEKVRTQIQNMAVRQASTRARAVVKGFGSLPGSSHRHIYEKVIENLHQFVAAFYDAIEHGKLDDAEQAVVKIEVIGNAFPPDRGEA